MLQSKEVGMLPILLLFFNRKDTLFYVIGQVRKYKPSRLYLASDGPRSAVQNEIQLIGEIRQFVLDSIDWECEVKTLFRDENLGCKKAVHEGIQWFFSQEEKGTVLEDDIVPSLNFFHFCEETLELFKDDKRIATITGRNELQQWGKRDVFFASRFQCWGWASWSDRILGMDVDYGYREQDDYSGLYLDRSWEERWHLDSTFGFLQTNQVSSWASSYDLSFKLKKQLHLYPKYNMVKNIGFGDAGTHSFSKSVDTVDVYEEFIPKVFNVPILDDRNYISKKLRTEFGGILQLFILRYSRHLSWLRTTVRFLRKMKEKIL